jgi:hypothetical protein
MIPEREGITVLVCSGWSKVEIGAAGGLSRMEMR